MKKVKFDLPYFGERGITTTAALHLANIGQEYIAECKAKIENLSFVNVYLSTIDSAPEAKGLLTSHGSERGDIDDIVGMAKTMADINGFCAWMREAARAKEKIAEEIGELTMQDYIKEKNIENEEYHPKASPTEEDVVKEMSLKERADYLAWEAKAAAFGKLVHPGGKVSEARKTLLRRMQDAVETQTIEGTMYVYKYEPSVETEAADKLFYDIQAEYREAEKNLNMMKARVAERLRERQARFAAEEKQRIADEVARKRQLTIDFTEWQQSLQAKASALKVAIPQMYEETYKMLTGLDERRKA